MKLQKRVMVILAAIAITMAGSMNVQAQNEGLTQTTSLSENNSDIGTEQAEPITMVPISNKVVMRKELGTARVPLIISGDAVVTEVTSNRADFQAELLDGVLYVTAQHTANLPDYSDSIVNFTVKGTNQNLLPFEVSLQITFEMESKQLVEDIMEEEISIDTKSLSSYDCTIRSNEFDRRLIAQSNLDFSEYTIVCIGDSITEGVGLKEGTEALYAYPADLQKILGAGQVLNLGRGGASIASYWDSFFSSLEGIPLDADVIIVLGGVNDCYAGNEENIGNIEDCSPGTFYGDADYLMNDLKNTYPDSLIMFGTPLSTITNQTYLSFLPNMLPLSRYADAIKELGEKNDIPIIDMYHERFLDSNDEEIMNQFMYDGVHPNIFGYQLLAEHIAGEMIRLKQE